MYVWEWRVCLTIIKNGHDRQFVRYISHPNRKGEFYLDNNFILGFVRLRARPLGSGEH